MSGGLDLSIRSTGIGSSEAGAIIGVSPFATRLDIYMRKVFGEKTRRETPIQRWGLLHEAAMHIAYEQDTGLTLVGDGRTTIRHPKHEWMLDTVDRITSCRTRVVDFKTAQRFTPVDYGQTNWDFQVWDASLHASRDETDLIPQCHQAQGVWHMACHDIDNFDLPLLIDGFQWRIFSMERDLEVEEMLIDEVHRFWVDHVLARKPPEHEDEDEREEFLKLLYPKHESPTLLETTPEIDEKVSEFRTAYEQHKLLEAEVKRTKNDLKELIGDAAGIAGPWGKIAWTTDKNGVRSFTPRFKETE